MAEYNHKAIEKKWQDYWEKEQTFKVGAPGAKKLYVLDMFPYPSGAGLHVGHPLGYTGTDIYCRFKRMQGYSVLHPMGYDAFGLPAEQHAMDTGEHPSKLTLENCKRFTSQLKALGFSYDWGRELATCTPDYYKWTQWIFLKIYNSWFDEDQQRARPIEELPIPQEVQASGYKAVHDFQAKHRLAYYADAMVNWCPALGTVLANEEVIEGRSERGGHEVVRRPMKQWMLRITSYAERLLSELDEIDWPDSIKEQQRNWIGKRYGAEIDFAVDGSAQVLKAFTTRPDTLFGVTFFVISAEHPLVAKLTKPEQQESVEKYCQNAAKLSEMARTMETRQKTGEFTGSYVINPITGEKVPLYVGDYVLMSYGTGAVMGVPSHDSRDFEFAKKFGIPIRPVIAPESADAQLKEAVIRGEADWTEPGIMLPCSFAAAGELGLEGKPSEEAKRLITSWLERNGKGRGVINYRLRDWLFSRQRYWGEPIPIVHWDDGTCSALEEGELPLVLPEVQDYKPFSDGQSPLAKAENWLLVKDPKTGRTGRRETNTMPQWAGSCWYYLRFIDPHNQDRGWEAELEKAWMPVDLYVGGAEHAVLHLLYSRFWHKVLYDLGFVSTKEPFKRLFNQGMLVSYAYKNERGILIPLDEVEEDSSGTVRHKGDGEILERITAKMSKSLRNVITTDDTVEMYGADTLRMFLMFMGPLEAMKSWDSYAISGVYRFLKKAWNYVDSYLEGGCLDAVPEGQEQRSVTVLLHQTIKKVSDNLDGLRFNTVVSTLMEFLNGISNERVCRSTLEKFVLMLSPMAPHLAEDLWQRLGHTQSLAYEAWPEYDPAFLKQDVVTVVLQVNGKKRATLEVPVPISADALKAQIIEHMAGTNYQVSDGDKFITVFDSATKAPKLVNVIRSA